MSKAYANVNECLLLIQLKRRNAVSAMKQIVVGFGLPPHSLPDVLTILEYLTNMVYCIEMMLKLLSGDWKSHNVGRMYENVFGRAHGHQALMDDIATALRDQKYLFEPNGGLLARIEGLEALHDVLRWKLLQTYDKFAISRSIPAPAGFLGFLREHVTRFYSKSGPTIRFCGVQREGINMKVQMQALQAAADRELSEIHSFFDQWIKDGRPFEFIHEQVSMA